jgi:CubicO group peptidase (beta-lactamase class C family)
MIRKRGLRGFIGAAALVAGFLPLLLAEDEKTAQVDKLFAGWDTRTTPGAALAIVRDGRIIYERGYGMAKLEDDIAMTPSKIFDVGSVSKQFTAACVALLVHDGKIAVKDDIRTYLPEMPAYERPITIDHLLHHTSGVRDYNDLLSLAGFRAESDCPTVEEALGIITRQKKLDFLPGDEYSYSNSGYFLLGQIVERMSGKSLNAFAQERIFKPLGMTHTLYQEDHTQIIKDRATGYDRRGARFVIDMSNWDETGDGNVYTSVEDLAVWDQAFYSNALGKDVMDMLHTTGILNDGKKLEYAWGLEILEYRGLRLVGHGGSWAGFRAAIVRFPEQRFSVICLANRSGTDPFSLGLRVADIYLAEAMKPAPPQAKPPAPAKKAENFPPLDPAKLQEFCGVYVSDELMGAAYTFAVVDGRPAIKSRTGPKGTILRAAGPDAFAQGGLRITFVRDAGGKVAGFKIDVGRARGIEFARK